MKLGFSVEEAVKNRYSVRSYEKRPVDDQMKQKILSYAGELKNPLGPQMRVQLIEKDTAPNGEKLGTYGIIKGTNLYLGVTIPDEVYAMEALGYDFEQLVLYATSLGLGTCWLGGTFNRSAFTKAMEIREGELFPILSPLGYPAKKRSLTEQVMRRSIKADARLSWKELFFVNDFRNPLTEEEAGEYRFPLEMLRLAPSAVNKQPWRVLKDDNGFHFFEKHSLGGEHGSIDMQRIDVGIGICHFHLAAMERNLLGHFERKQPDLETSKDMTYIASWIFE